MTQPTDITLANQSGANFRTELNSILQGFGSTQKGSTAPTYGVTGMHWIDDSSTPWIEKVYDGTDWISIYEINATTNTIRIINQADGTARTGGANIGQIQDGAFTWLGTTSGTNTVTASLTPAITAYVTGGVYRFIVGTTNTGAVTLNVNSVGAKAVQFQGAALAANSLVAGDVISVVYDGTQFQVVSPVGGTAGDILYYNANNQLTRLPKGTDDQVLTLASGLPAWADAGGGGGWIPIQTQTVSSAVASVDFTTGIDSTYKANVIIGLGIKVTTDASGIGLRTSSNGGSSYDSTAGDYDDSSNYMRPGLNTYQSSGSTNATEININRSNNIGSASNEYANIVFYIYNPSDTATDTMIEGVLTAINSSNEMERTTFAGRRKATSAVDAVRIFLPTGTTFSAGTFTLYGLAGA